MTLNEARRSTGTAATDSSPKPRLAKRASIPSEMERAKRRCRPRRTSPDGRVGRSSWSGVSVGPHTQTTPWRLMAPPSELTTARTASKESNSYPRSTQRSFRDAARARGQGQGRGRGTRVRARDRKAQAEPTHSPDQPMAEGGDTHDHQAIADARRACEDRHAQTRRTATDTKEPPQGEAALRPESGS